jgi:hypothetical protein
VVLIVDEPDFSTLDFDAAFLENLWNDIKTLLDKQVPCFDAK